MPSDPFLRHTYHCIEGSDEDTVDGDWQAYLDVSTPGAYEFFTEFSRFRDGTYISRIPHSATGEGSGEAKPAGADGHGYTAPPDTPPAPLVAISSEAPPGAASPRPRRKRRSSLVGSLSRGVYVNPPNPARRGATVRFVVQPELSVRLLRPMGFSVPASAPALLQGVLTSPPSTQRSGSAGELSVTSPAESLSWGRRHITPSSLQGDSVPTAELLPALAVPGDDGPCEDIMLPLPLEGITLQTQLTRCLGPIDGWLRVNRLPVADEDAPDLVITGTLAEPLACKFNFLHFTPVQRLGGSNSAYSLADQWCLEWNMFAGNAFVMQAVRAACASMPWFASMRAENKDGASVPAEAALRVWGHPRVEAAKMLVLQRMIDIIERKHGALSMVDVVMNHTSTDSLWLRDHPEAGYSLRNSPHLRAAFELDETILRVSAAVRAGQVPNVGAAMRDEGSVNAVVDVLRHHPTLGLPGARLWEFYCVDEPGTLAAVVAHMPGIDVDEDEADLLTQADNVPGGDVFAVQPPAPLVTAGVEPADISDERAVEIVASRQAVVKEILAAFKSQGYADGRGGGCVHITDGDVERIAHALLKPAPTPPISEAVARLKARVRRLATKLDHELSATGSHDAAVHMRSDGAWPTPLASPSASPASDMPPPPANAFPFGRPPQPPQNAIGSAVPPALISPPVTSPTAHWWRSQGAAADSPPRRRMNVNGVPTTRTGVPVSSTRARSVHRRAFGSAFSSTGGSGTPGYGTPGLSAPTPVPGTPAGWAPPSGTMEYAGGVFNDNTGGRFSTHIDVYRVIAALNELPGVHIDPSAWTWRTKDGAVVPPVPGSTSAATAAPGPSGMALLPSLHLIRRVIQGVNLLLYRRYDADIAAALGAVRGTAQYQWLQLFHAQSSLSETRPLVYSYFARVPSREAGVTHVLACNGFIWNGDPEIDFTLPVDAARSYAAIVRAGTAEEEYLKRPRSWSSKRQAAAAEYLLGQEIVPDDAREDTAAPTGEAPSPAAYTATCATPPFAGASLLHLSTPTLEALVHACENGNWADAEAALQAAALLEAELTSSSLHTAAKEANVSPASSTSSPQSASDTTLHLDPDIIPLPVAAASTPYMRRDIVIWGDCVKLRYGLTPADSPWLWHYMSVYIRRMASLFHGLRVDNAHGTPLHVAAYMIDIARSVRPDLYVNAELFTGSLDRDVEYVSRLGINSLVREAMQCNSPGDLVRTVYSYGGVPVASLRPAVRGGTAAWRIENMLPPEQAGPLVSRVFASSQRDLHAPELLMTDENKDVLTSNASTIVSHLHAAAAAVAKLPRSVAVYHCINGFPVAALLEVTKRAHPTGSNAGAEAESRGAWMELHKTLLHMNEATVSTVLPAALPALFFDCTHDNPTPAEKRHAVDTLPSAVAVAATVCATGTNRGFDLLVPENISVVHDMRLYADPLVDESAAVSPSAAMTSAQPFAAREASMPLAPCVGARGAKYGVDLTRGIRLVRRRMNALKQELAVRGHTELFATCDPAPNGSDVVTVLRGHPWLPTSYVFISRTAFSRYAGDARGNHGALPSIRIEGRVVGVVMAASLHVPAQALRTPPPRGPRTAMKTQPWASEGAPAAPQDAMGIDNVVWTCPAEAPAGPRRTDDGRLFFDAHPRFINGLAASLEYVDDTMLDSAATLETSSLGLARFQELDGEGRAIAHPGPSPSPATAAGPRVTVVSLDAERFHPGSVLVLKVHAPRNVAIRGASSVTPEQTGANVSDGATDSCSGTPIRPVTSSASLDSSTSPAVGLPLTSPATWLGVEAEGTGTPADAAYSARSSRRSSILHAGADATSAPTSRPRAAWSHARAVTAAIGFALHGPLPARKPFSSASRASFSSFNSLIDAETPGHARRPSNSALLTPDTVFTDGVVRGNAVAVATSRTARKLSTFFGPPLAELENALLHDNRVTLESLNVLLFRANPEELDDSRGVRGVYAIPGLGPLPWAGIAGVQHALRHCRKWNDMAHPLMDNIRSGNWILDYTAGRLGDHPELAGVKDWLERHFAIVKMMPPGLRPQGFDRVITAAFHCAVAAALSRMRGPLFPANYSHSQHYLVCVSDAVAAARSAAEAAYFVGNPAELEDEHAIRAAPLEGVHGPRAMQVVAPSIDSFERHTDPAAPLPFLTALALTSVQLWGLTRSAPLLALPLIPATEAAPVRETAAASTEEMVSLPASLAAGVDHFCTGYMRTWGRDTFISLRGLLLVTGRFMEARQTILAFASVVRHGLVPNLMDGGQNPRFNCRDAAWWFLQAVQDYCEMAPEGTGILFARFRRRFPSDMQSDYGADGQYMAGRPVVCTLADIVLEILSRHARGIHFREWNAGRQIDAHMRDEGFNIDIRVDPDTGFVHGGNAWNCGTWMDKMGESGTHGTDGVPATPRDGADIEITALCFSALRWLARLQAQSSLPPSTVTLADGRTWTYAEWASRIAAAFERHYYVPLDPRHDAEHLIDHRYVNARGIYKDIVGSSAGWSDYQLRPNLLVAMAVAPELFDPVHADIALGRVEHQLLGEHQLGVKTLDPSDWAYRGNYDNSRDDERSVAKGWNYHQGPEWLWPFGYYLRARMLFPPGAAVAAELVEATGMPLHDTSVSRATAPSNTAPKMHHSDSFRVLPALSYASAVPPSHLRWRDYASLRRWVLVRLARHRTHLENSPDAGLPELTNANGAFCRDSCVSQAWSGATVLDALYDLHVLSEVYAGIDEAKAVLEQATGTLTQAGSTPILVAATPTTATANAPGAAKRQ